MKAELMEAYQSGKLILFAGAGVSANLGLPTWGELIAKIANELDYDPDIFATYGDHLALAEFYRKKKGSWGELRSWMDKEWHKASIDIGKSDIHQLIANGNFSKIYTTNYDRWLEEAYKHYNVAHTTIVNVSDIVKTQKSHRQIIKFHGDFSDDSSIVLGETSYYERLNFESPLDIKLRYDVLGNSVLFIGYSITDLNIRLLFYRLTKMWGNDVLASARPKSYLFTNRPNPVAKEVLAQWGIEILVSEEDDQKTALSSFLRELIGKEDPL